MQLEVLSPAIVSASALALVALERRLPYTPGQRLFRDGMFNDLALYSILQSYVLGFVIFGAVHALDELVPNGRLHVIAGLPIAVQVLLSLVIHDAYIYWFHRLQHRNRFLWRIHEAHHSTHDVDWLSGARSHSLEILVNQTVEFAPLILLGGHPDAIIIKGMIDAIWGMYIHANIDVRSGWLQYIINGPEMHRWHHAVDTEAHNRNFATKLAIWDWMFGTAFRPPGKPSGYGLAGVNFPRGYIRQHLFAFRRENKSSASGTGVVE